MVEGEQELVPVGVDACEQLVEGVAAGLASKAAVEGCFDLSPECCLGLLGVRAEFPVDGRDVTADPVDPPLRNRGGNAASRGAPGADTADRCRSAPALQRETRSKPGVRTRGRARPGSRS